MYNDIIYTLRLVNKQDLLSYIVMSFVYFKLINYSIQACFYVLSHRLIKITNLYILILILCLSLTPDLNLLSSIVLLGVLIATIIIKIVFATIIIFDIDISDKTFCQVLRILYMNIRQGSFRLL